MTAVGADYGSRDAEGASDGEPDASKVVDVAPYDRLTGPLEVAQRLLSAVCLAHPDDAIFPHQLDHRPQRVTRVQPV